MRTNSNIESSFAKTDGLIFIPAYDVVPIVVAAADAVLTKNATGDYSYNQIASKTCTYVVGIGQALRRLGLAPDLQEQFGTAAGVAGPSAVANTGSPAPADGRPPFTGQTQLTPSTSKALKGIKILDLTVHSLVTTLALTSATPSLNKIVYANAVANAVTNIPVTGALSTAVQATPYADKLTVTTPAFSVDDLSNISLEVAIVTPATSLYRFYGVSIHVAFNQL